MKEFEYLKRKFARDSGSNLLQLNLNWENPEQYDNETGEVVLKR
jgi:hypothetical protein